jgi:alpha-beta hydrolase superfamily lysophospholipase
MLQRFEGHFAGFDETELFFQTWSNSGASALVGANSQSEESGPRGTFIITHGLGEHSECYHPLAKVLAENGWHVMAWDLRGHGRSEGKRGYVNHFSDFRRDLEIFVRLARKQSRGAQTPFILFGHSMGGLITLEHFLHSGDPKPDACVLSSPAVGIAVHVPPFKVKLAEVAEKWLPAITLGNEINYSDLSRDEKMVTSYARDNLRHDKVSPGLYLGMQRAFKEVLSNPAYFEIPFLFQIAGDDHIVSAEAARELFSKLPNKKNQLSLYPDSYHEIYNDLDRENVIADLKKFLGTFKRAI